MKSQFCCGVKFENQNKQTIQTIFHFSKNAGNVEDQLTKWRLDRRNRSNSPIRLDPIKKQNVSKVSDESKNDQESQNQAKIEYDEGETKLHFLLILTFFQLIFHISKIFSSANCYWTLLLGIS